MKPSLKKIFWGHANEDKPAPIGKIHDFVTTAGAALRQLNDALDQGQKIPAEKIHMPAEIVGGFCPAVPGRGHQMAWQAVAEAMDTERVHIVWSEAQERVWFLGVRSADLASHANSWCPFASVLPGQPAAVAGAACYIHAGEEEATMMAVAPDRLHIHRGTLAIIESKAERVARELGGAKIVRLMPDDLDRLVATPWVSLSLLEERAARMMMLTMAVAGLGVLLLSFAAWLLLVILMVALDADLDVAKIHAASSAQVLLQQAEDLKVSKLRKSMGDFAAVNDGLIQLGGWLRKYEIDKGKVAWRATVPFGVTSDKITDLGAHTIETAPEGFVIEGH